ncbi:carboxylesterase family protein [Hymenobacter taeanensis]|uniref:Carboxylic ester hydrolase n=1 Tax=Hymenobacter taeanensis TaxID=2735321 RepID=A0A6M6BJP9_9BACT|nr:MULTISPECIES: carboxylesterase/lipase family protein [Hymenobacter]QJX48088.1 carboxylesterase family protein [Hymenobacter taeanensis]UOQ82450.1 carboxylesterase family protein [Hymenobacter sp. 5414T-23]
MKISLILLLLTVQLVPMAGAQSKKASGSGLAANRVQVATGLLEGTTAASGIHEFKGVPFAAPPVGQFRWRAPQPMPHWAGVRQTKQFGPRAMQLPLFGDMNFRSNGVSEDCLYLNVWTPAKSGQERLPVLVYFYGGGFVAGDGSEPRYDGESMAKRGIVAVTVNYRLGVFGFMAHPELTQESPNKASGNYGFLDQSAALRWVQQNIAAFGGDPKRVTIAGESAGSMSVSAQMVSPLSKNLFAGAIGESGSMLNTGFGPLPLAEGEKNGVAFATGLGATTLAALRAIPAQQLLEAAGKPGTPRFAPTIDGYFFTEKPTATFVAGQQAHVPLLVGWNSQEMGYQALLGQEAPTPESFRNAVTKLYGDKAEAVLKQYPATTAQEAEQAATDLASDRFIAYSTWKWADMHSQTGGQPVYRYLYARPRPAMTPEMGNATAGLAGGVIKQSDSAPKAPTARGAVHSAEIEYALGNLATNKVYAWTPDDYKVSDTMQRYFANFIKTGNPNGSGLPKWPAATGTPVPVLHLDVNTRVEPDTHRARYEFLDQQAAK